MAFAPAVFRTPPSLEETKFVAYTGPPPSKPRKTATAGLGKSRTPPAQQTNPRLPADTKRKRQHQDVEDDDGYISIDEILHANRSSPEIPETQPLDQDKRPHHEDEFEHREDEAVPAGSIPQHPINVSDTSDFDSSDGEEQSADERTLQPLPNQSSTAGLSGGNKPGNTQAGPDDVCLDLANTDGMAGALMVSQPNASAPTMNSVAFPDGVASGGSQISLGRDTPSPEPHRASEIGAQAAVPTPGRAQSGPQRDASAESEHSKVNQPSSDGSVRSGRPRSLKRFDTSVTSEPLSTLPRYTTPSTHQVRSPNSNDDGDAPTSDTDSDVASPSLSTVDAYHVTGSHHAVLRHKGGSSGKQQTTIVRVDQAISASSSVAGWSSRCEPADKTVSHGAKSGEATGIKRPGPALTWTSHKRARRPPRVKRQLFNDARPTGDTNSESGNNRALPRTRSYLRSSQPTHHYPPHTYKPFDKDHQLPITNRVKHYSPLSGVHVDLLHVTELIWTLSISGRGVHRSKAGLHNSNIRQAIVDAAGSDYQLSHIADYADEDVILLMALVHVMPAMSQIQRGCHSSSRFPGLAEETHRPRRTTSRASACTSGLVSVEGDIDAGSEDDSGSGSDYMDSPGLRNDHRSTDGAADDPDETDWCSQHVKHEPWAESEDEHLRM